MYRVAQLSPSTPGVPAFDSSQNVSARRVLPSSLQKGFAAAPNVGQASTPRAPLQISATHLQATTASHTGQAIARQRSVEVPRERLMTSSTPKIGGGVASPRPAPSTLQRSHLPHMVSKIAPGAQQLNGHSVTARPAKEAPVVRAAIGTTYGYVLEERLYSPRIYSPRIAASAEFATANVGSNLMDSTSLMKDVREDLQSMLAKFTEPKASLAQRVEQFEHIVFTRLRSLEKKLPAVDVSDRVGLEDFVRSRVDRQFGEQTDTTPTLSGADLDLALGKDDTDLDAESPNTLSIDGTVIVVKVVRDSMEDKLGMDVRHIDGQLCVLRLDPDGAVARANYCNSTMDPPGDALELGDVIFRINEVEFSEEEDSDRLMVEECKQKLELVIHAMRP